MTLFGYLSKSVNIEGKSFCQYCQHILIFFFCGEIDVVVNTVNFDHGRFDLSVSDITRQFIQNSSNKNSCRIMILISALFRCVYTVLHFSELMSRFWPQQSCDLRHLSVASFHMTVRKRLFRRSLCSCIIFDRCLSVINLCLVFSSWPFLDSIVPTAWSRSG